MRSRSRPPNEPFINQIPDVFHRRCETPDPVRGLRQGVSFRPLARVLAPSLALAGAGRLRSGRALPNDSTHPAFPITEMPMKMSKRQTRHSAARTAGKHESTRLGRGGGG